MTVSTNHFNPPAPRVVISMLKNNQTMQLNGSTLLAGCSGQLGQPGHLPATFGLVEQALFHARLALDAGWQLTPKEVVALVGPGAWRDDSVASGTHETAPESEDEIDEIPLFFGER